jgi:hypothetical protein
VEKRKEIMWELTDKLIDKVDYYVTTTPSTIIGRIIKIFVWPFIILGFISFLPIAFLLMVFYYVIVVPYEYIRYGKIPK